MGLDTRFKKTIASISSESQNSYKKNAPSDLAKSYRAYRKVLNRPIIERDAISRDMKLPSQKQYKDLASLVSCIETLDGVLFVLSQQIEREEIATKERKERHRERYKREPQLANLDPHKYVISNKLKTLKARQTSNTILVSQMKRAYEELARKPYQPKADVNAPLRSKHAERRL